MLAEVGLAFVEEEHRISRAVEAGKVPLLMLRMEILVAGSFSAAVLAAFGRRGLFFDGGDVGLQRGDLG